MHVNTRSSLAHTVAKRVHIHVLSRVNCFKLKYCAVSLQCSATCGDGLQIRNITCKSKQKYLTCDPMTEPRRTKTCLTNVPCYRKYITYTTIIIITTRCFGFIFFVRCACTTVLLFHFIAGRTWVDMFWHHSVPLKL